MLTPMEVDMVGLAGTAPYIDMMLLMTQTVRQNDCIFMKFTIIGLRS